MAARRPRHDRRRRRTAGALADARRPDATASISSPAFVGLGAPYWDADARGAICGLTRGTAAARSPAPRWRRVGYQTRDLVDGDARRLAGADASASLRVDGGMAASDWTMQFLADMLGVAVDRPANPRDDRARRGLRRRLAGRRHARPESFADRRRRDRVFAPAMDDASREALYRGWREAVRRAL